MTLKSTFRWLPTVLLSALTGLVAQAGPAPAASSDHQTFLRQHRANHVRALLEGDASFLAAVAAEDIRLMTESQPTVFGAANAVAYYRALLNRFTVSECTRESLGSFDFGARVVEIGRLRHRLTPKAAGPTADLTGKYLEVWTKQPDGGLKLVTTAWNYDAWPADGEALRFPEVSSVRTAFLGRAPVGSNVSFELAALGRLLEAAIVQHDGELWHRFYAPDAVLLANHTALRTGTAEIGDYIRAHSRELPVFEKLDIRNDRIEELGDYVFEYASHVANWRAGDASGVNTGKNLRIWRREPDHALKLVLQIGAYD
jgi:ketosteroid isomerase-like protein